MGEIQSIEDELMDLKNQLVAVSYVKEEVWAYHPANPYFINPISLYESLNIEINSIERKINELEFKLNSIN
jgi:hypothetical protein